MKNKIALAVAAMSVAATSAVQAATPLDLSGVTGAFTASDVVTPVIAIAGTLATVYVAIKAAKIVLGMLRGR
ncbi:major capsid protein [Oxalobacteraceae bacterium AB_14]|uniref:major capsid protein n=1 Tax=Duganella sp. BuS-21 TaxID=2943848 RepID=UPI00037CC8E3|nr:major capsid protein [Pseudomonas fluorescens]